MKVAPNEGSNDDKIGYFIMVFMNLTFLGIVANVSFLLFYDAPHTSNIID